MIGTVLANRYELVREIGRGGMGVVYLARDLVLEREVAVKLLPQGQLSPEAEQRLRREARVVARLDHPGIVPLHDIAEHDGSIFIVMPFVQGTSLRRLLQERQLSPAEAVDLVIQIAEALDYSHSLGVVHRDVKPENVLVTAEPGGRQRARLTDFGIAAAEFEEHTTQAGMILGTGAYLSPEQISEGAVDARTDVYALGALLYECLSGRPPFAGAGSSLYYRIAFVPPRPLRSWRPEVPADLEEVALRCIEKDPARRPQSARQVADALLLHRAGRDALAGGAGAPLPAPPPAARAQAPSVLVGRDAELGELATRLAWASAGEAQLVLVAGDAGVGKSRLLEELDRLAVSRGVRVMHGRFFGHDQAFPYQGFCDVIQEHFLTAVTSPTGPGAAFADLGPDLAALFPSLSEIVPTRTTGAEAVSSGASHGAFAERTEVYELLARTVARIGGGRPLAILLEDVHASEASVEALQYIARRLAATPTLVVATYRTSEVDRTHPIARLLDNFRGDRRFALVRLEPFDAARHRDLVASLLGSPRVDDAFLAELYGATEGNPFFTVELVRALVDSGALAPDEHGGWALALGAAVPSEALPEAIRRTVEDRIKRLDRRERDVLSSASVLGRAFLFRDLELLCDDRADLEEAVDRLVELGFLEEGRDARGDRLSFASAIVREALYAALSRRRRRALHAAYAQRLERHRASRIEGVLPQLVHHYARAGAAEKVVAHGLALAKRSLDAYSAEAAARVARTVLEFLPEAGEDGAHEGRARCLHAAALRLSGEFEGALAEYARAVDAFERAGAAEEAADAMARAAEAAWEARLVERAEAWLDRAIRAGRELPAEPAEGARVAVLSKALRLAATLANLRGATDAASRHIEELNALRGAGPDAAASTDPDGRLVVAHPSQLLSRHPIDTRTKAEEELFATVAETLATTDASGVPVPALAARWELDEAATVCRVALRPDAVAHDGRPVRAADVKAAWEEAIRRCRRQLPPAFRALAGADDLAEGRASELSGAAVRSELELELRLEEPTPIFPMLLTDVRTSVAFARPGADGSGLVATGPFAVASFEPDRVVVERAHSPRPGAAPSLRSVEVRGNLRSSEIADGLRSGAFDVGRGISAEEIRELLRDRRRRFRLLEAPSANVWFLLFNGGGRLGSNAAFRAALGAITRGRDVVREALGRLALPAEGLLPPNTLGHDPNRRRRAASAEEIERLLAACGLERPVRMRAAVAAAFHDRFRPLLETLLRLWALHGVEAEVDVPRGMEYYDDRDYVASVDVLLGGWAADYNDPDTFTYQCFHSAAGAYRHYVATPDLDALLERGRRERGPEERRRVYADVEEALLGADLVVPLLHELEHRVATRRVARAELSAAPPYLNYTEVAVRAPGWEREGRRSGGTPVVPLPVGVVLADLDPASIHMDLECEVVSTVFETLTRSAEGAHIVPWLARSVEAEQDGRRYRFRLRDGVLFHDGRAVTARDVRYSLERLLRHERSTYRWQLAPVRGAADVLSGAAGELEGFQIVSRSEFTIELERPLAFFPALLSHPATAVVPEGSGEIAAAQSAVGTGPFRVVGFEPGARLELEANAAYWRQGLPRCDGLVFEADLGPADVAAGFRDGRYAVAFSLFSGDEEALRRDPRFAAGYREAPCLQTVLLAFNVHAGPFADPEALRRLVAGLDVDALVRRACGRLGTPARGLIPPGLLGYDPLRRTTGQLARARPAAAAAAAAAACLMRPLFAVGAGSGLRAELFAEAERLGTRLEALAPAPPDWDAARAAGAADCFLLGWTADFPDADAFAYGLLHSRAGWVGAFCGTPELDRLVERARHEVDPEARHHVYREIEDEVARGALALPLFHPRTSRFARPELHGLEVGFVSPFVDYAKLWMEW